MNWKASTLEFLGEAMRFAWRICLALDVNLMSVFSVWFTAKFLWQLGGWLTRTIFRTPW